MKILPNHVANKKLLLHSVALCFFCFQQQVYATEWALESNVASSVIYNDNIFMTTLPHDSVTGVLITPSAKFEASEADWETGVVARLRNNSYSDSNLDSNDILLGLNTSMKSERNAYSFNGGYDLNSSLNTESDEFGITGSRVKSRRWNVSPEYSRQVTERVSVSFGYNHSDTNFKDAESTGLVSSVSNGLNTSFGYNITEITQLSVVLQFSNYEQGSGSFEYDQAVVRAGLTHRYSERFSSNVLVGKSQTDSISRTALAPFDFFGTTIVRTVETDFRSTSLVLDASFDMAFEAGSLSGSLSRDSRTDSFGGLNEVKTVRVNLNQSATDLWRYSLSVKYEEVESIGSNTSFSDRELLSFQPKLSYSYSRDWRMTASYRYIKREFKNSNTNSTPDSNMISIGLAYNFPSISTF